MRVAALTMVYNEPVWARVWARHYARQVGAEHCLVLDHGSDGWQHGGAGGRGGADAAVGAGRGCAGGGWSRTACGSCCGGMTRWCIRMRTSCWWRIPAGMRTCGRMRRRRPEVATAVGLDLQHLPDEEAALDPARPVGRAAAVGAVQWGDVQAGVGAAAGAVGAGVPWVRCGARCVGAAVSCVHLRYADLGAGLARLARTRGQAFARAEPNPHQRVADEAFEAMMRAIARLPRQEGPMLAHVRGAVDGADGGGVGAGGRAAWAGGGCAVAAAAEDSATLYVTCACWRDREAGSGVRAAIPGGWWWQRQGDRRVRAVSQQRDQVVRGGRGRWWPGRFAPRFRCGRRRVRRPVQAPSVPPGALSGGCRRSLGSARRRDRIAGARGGEATGRCFGPGHGDQASGDRDDACHSAAG